MGSQDGLEEQLAEAQALTHIGSWDWDVAANRVTWSAELYKIFGLDPTAFGATLEAYLACVHADDREVVRESIQRALATGEPFDHRDRIVRPDGSLVYLHSRGRRLVDDTGAPRKLVGTCRDVTEEQRLREQMYRMQRMDAVGRLAGGIAHDFNNLLTVILSYAEMLSRRPDDPARVRAAVGEIKAAGESAAAMSRQLLTFARGEIAPMSVVSIGQAVRESERLLARLIGEHVRLVIDLDDDIGRVRCSRSQLEQVLVNLAVNARDAMPRGGHLTIRGRNAKARPEDRLDLPEGEYVVLEVQDDGEGMSPDVAARAFEPFYTTKPEGQGTGLGLSTIYGIVKQTGGDVELVSWPGSGTTVRVWLPRTRDAASDRLEPTPSLGGADGKRILLVEDAVKLRELLESVLADAGYRVKGTGSSLAALALLEDDTRRPEVLVVDVVLPGLSGADLAARARSRYPGLPIVYMSGYPKSGAHPRIELGDHTEFLHKPFTPDELLLAIQTAIGQD
jgi:PAS domain S-box-containing protein